MRSPDQVSFAFPKPGKALIGMMAAMTVIWIAFAIVSNWGAASLAGIFGYFVGNSELVLHGQVWRLVTAAFIHAPDSPGHLLGTLMGLYFFGTALEDRWGPLKTVVFMVGCAALAFAVQMLVGLVLPALNQEVWVGGLGMAAAVAVAWAMQSRGGHVLLFFVLPVTPLMLVGFIFVMAVFNVFARNMTTEGLVTPFAAMAAGYLFSDASPLRRTWLKLRLKRLDAQSAALRSASKRRARSSDLRVIRGGQETPKDKRYLN